MSGPTQDVGKTLTGGIQDVSAILPLLGTDQCEQHVGSALDGGFLYAAAAPLSIFGSLGIVKVGISVLISSISIPKISISLRTLSMKFSQERWLGARTLDNAGFRPAGTVAALIAMDGTCYKAETRLMQILEEKHIDNPENLSIKWKSRDWNVSLVLFTMIAAAISGTPYIALLLQNSQPSLVHTPWIFPLLRSVGSCLAAVCCQFLIQSRIISLMKNRIVVMTMHSVLVDDLKSKHNKPDLDFAHEEHLRWDEDLPAEQCLWNLERFLRGLLTQPSDGPNEPADHVSITMKTLSFSDPRYIRDKLQELRNKHFPTPALDRGFVLSSWIVLCLSLPATVAGYIGCFTLVSNSKGNGPLIWLGLEAALSIVRILVWASNPGWDEEKLTVNVELAEDHPLVTTEQNIQVIETTGNNTLALVPERRFLEWITPYTGPLEQFRSPENLTLYFTLTATGPEPGPEQKHLYMTIFDFNKRMAIVLRREKEGFMYIDADVVCNRIASEMEARLQSAISEKHPWQTNDPSLFNDLEKYYESITHALNRTSPYPIRTLKWKWNLDLLPGRAESNNQSCDRVLNAPSPHDQLYLDRGYEHHLKTRLIKIWSEWIVEDMEAIRSDAGFDCHHALADPTSEKAKWELTELDSQLAWEWTRRELSLVLSSIKLEEVLKGRMEECIRKISEEQESGRLKEWMLSEFVIGQRKRLEKEREQTKERMEKGMRDASERSEREGRQWRAHEWFSPQWENGLKFIDEQWLAGVEARHLAAPKNAVSQLDELFKQNQDLRWAYAEEAETRDPFVEQVSQRFLHWHLQRENERYEMDATIKGISDADGKHPDDHYEYPGSDPTATARFVVLRWHEPVAKVCSAIVYDVGSCKPHIIFDVIKKNTTRSVINVDPDLLDSIPENDHLLYIGSDPGKEPVFIQRNRDRWWEQQSSNSSTFYFSPQEVGHGCIMGSEVTIAHIFIFLKTASRLRLRLLHGRRYHANVSVSIQENSTELHCISFPDSIPENSFLLQDYELDHFEPGKHKLELVVTRSDARSIGLWRAHYFLRDILIEFFNNPPLRFSGDEDGDSRQP